MPTIDQDRVILISMPPEMKAWVRAEAKANDRSMSAEVRRMIEQARSDRSQPRGKRNDRPAE